MYGAICPSSGDSCGLVLPVANGEGMRLHIEEISKQVPQGRHAVVVMDGAGWHQKTLNMHNVSILRLPPYSPELNPVEQVWQWIKSKHLSNRCFDNYEAILIAACEAWNIFANNVQVVKSIGMREWIL